MADKRNRKRKGAIVFAETDYAKIQTLAAYMSQDDIAAMLGRTSRTFRKYKQEDPELARAVAAGKAEADQKVVKKLYDNALAGDHKAIEFWLRNRRPEEWGKDRGLNITHSGEVTLSTKEVEDKITKLAELLERTRNVIEVKAVELRGEHGSEGDAGDGDSTNLLGTREDETPD